MLWGLALLGFGLLLVGIAISFAADLACLAIGWPWPWPWRRAR